MTLKTGAVKDLSDQPLLDAIPIAFDAVQVGPRDYAWRSDAPATLVWIEARDGGDPKAAAPVRDRLMKLTAPFDGPGEVLLTSPMRVRSVEWANDHLALATEWRWSDRRSRSLLSTRVPVGAPGRRCTQDRRKIAITARAGRYRKSTLEVNRLCS